ncbi:unnamed protein product, partial [Ectocarpus sp. 12 AP-2014]
NQEQRCVCGAFLGRQTQIPPDGLTCTTPPDRPILHVYPRHVYPRACAPPGLPRNSTKQRYAPPPLNAASTLAALPLFLRSIANRWNHLPNKRKEVCIRRHNCRLVSRASLPTSSGSSSSRSSSSNSRRWSRRSHTRLLHDESGLHN